MQKKLKKILKNLKLNENTISTVLGALVLVVVGILIYNYFNSINKGQITQLAPEVSATPGAVKIVEENGQQVPQGLPTTYIVKKGDHLWKIAESYYTSGYNWVDIAKTNKLKNASKIEVGQKLEIPKVAIRKVTLVATTKLPPIDASSYTTVKGDFLWNIAIRAYGDGYAWSKIYTANKAKIGKNANHLPVGIVLVIPR